MIVPAKNGNENPGDASSIRPLKNKLFTDEIKERKSRWEPIKNTKPEHGQNGLLPD